MKFKRRKRSYKKRQRTPRQRQNRLRKYMKLGMAVLGILCVALVVLRVTGVNPFKRAYSENAGEDIEAVKPDIDVELLTENPYSRPGTATDQITGIVVHYTANPGSTAMDNRNYFEGLKDSHITKASSNFVVGLDGEVVQCIPTSEMSYATNSRNVDTISIECCHPDETGQFNDATYSSAVKLTAWLCTRFGLDTDQVIRHYDVTGKDCPKYYVENPDAWFRMKSDIAAQIQTDYELQGK